MIIFHGSKWQMAMGIIWVALYGGTIRPHIRVQRIIAVMQEKKIALCINSKREQEKEAASCYLSRGHSFLFHLEVYVIFDGFVEVSLII